MRTKHLWLSVVTGAAVGAASYYLKKKLSSASAESDVFLLVGEIPNPPEYASGAATRFVPNHYGGQLTAAPSLFLFEHFAPGYPFREFGQCWP